MKIVFLDSDTVGNLKELDQLNKLGDVQLYPHTNQSQIWERIESADVILTNKIKITKEHMLFAKRLKLICITATGMNNVDLDFARERNISVKNVSAYARETVAQHSFAVLLHNLHQIRFYDDYVKSGEYSESPIFTNISRDFYELYNKRIGIIGLGNIGKSVARIAKHGFGMEVVYHSPSGKNKNDDYSSLQLDELLSTSDIVSIHTSLNEHTRNLIDLEKIRCMKSTAILINMGRGGIINEFDLAKAIDQNLIRGACIDVFEKEPLPLNHPYLNIKEKSRIVFSPHIAWAALEARSRLMHVVIKHIDEFITESKELASM